MKALTQIFKQMFKHESMFTVSQILLLTGFIFSSITMPQSAHANAAQCPDILLDKTDPTLTDIPVWHQYNSASCFSYSASYLAMSWIRKKWPQFQSEFQKYTIEPAFVANDIEHEWPAAKNRIMDAENGRTCMSLDWIFEKIKTNRNLPIPRCSMYGLDRIGKNQVLKDPRDLEMRMRELVNRRNVFAIEYCRGAQLHPQKNFIHNRTFREKLTYLNTPAESENFAPGCDFHVAVIVGQSFRNEKCQLRIRDSWGQSLGDDFGHVWVDSDSLSRNVLRVVSMD